MIRFLYQILDFFGSVFAWLSPVCIIHWMIEATGQPSLMTLVQWMDPFFKPLDAVFDPLFRPLYAMFSAILVNPVLGIFHNLAESFGHGKLIPTEIPYDLAINTASQPIPITQGLLGLVFTILFFLFSFGSQMLKAFEQRLDLTKQDLIQRRRLQQLQTEQKKSQQKAMVNKSALVYIHGDFQKNVQSIGYFDGNYHKYGGRQVDLSHDSMTYEFQSTDKALNYAQEALKQLLNYYRSLRPMDPQPGFKLGIHAYDRNQPVEEVIVLCKTLSNYAGDNQAILSNDLRANLEAHGLAQNFKLSPIGAYYLEGVGAQELFRLMT